jgi:hypothetical protein
VAKRSHITTAAGRWARAGLLAGVAFSALAVGGVALVVRAQQPPLMLPPSSPLPQKRGLGEHAVPSQAPLAQAPLAPQSPGAAPPGAPAPTVKITVTTNPPAKRVFVLWGKKRLGMIMPRQPLIIVRPRDSGPLDLTVQCEGYVTVQTRAFTLADGKLIVKITPLEEKNTLLGYREEPPPEPDAGVPPPAPPPAPAPGAALAPGMPVVPAPPPLLVPDAGAR